jgi:hypothetical protein
MDATSLVSVFQRMLHDLSSAFTRPTAETFRQVAVGWILAPGAGAVTGMIRALGSAATKHWTVYEKFFYRASWSLETLSRLVLTRLIAPWLGQTVHVVIDDTTCGPRGKHVALAGWWKDASAHAQAPVIHWAHNWVVAAVILRPKRWRSLRLALPVGFALHRKRVDCTADHPYRTVQELARHLVCQIVEALPDRRIVVAMDGLYATQEFFGDLPETVVGISRLRKNAALRTAEVPDSRGNRRRVRGERLPALEALTEQAQTWKTVTLRKQGRTVRRQIHGLTCQWYHVCRCEPVRVVLVRDRTGREDDLHVVCTDPARSDTAIVQEFYDRWGIEECIKEGKQQMGMERTRGWCAKTVSRQAPLAMLLASLVKLWYVQHAADLAQWQPARRPWYRQKSGPSFRDMLAALRRVLWEDRLMCNFHTLRKSNKLADALTYALCEAA